MSGPQRMPTKLKELKGTLEKSRTFENEVEYAPLEYIPEAPADLVTAAKNYWLMCCVSLSAVGLLFSPDLPLLKRYCFSLWMVDEAMLALKDMDVIVIQKNKAGHKYEKKTQWTNLYLEFSKEATTIGREFGFSPSARTKIAVQVNPNKDPLDDLLPAN